MIQHCRKRSSSCIKPSAPFSRCRRLATVVPHTPLPAAHAQATRISTAEYGQPLPFTHPHLFPSFSTPVLSSSKASISSTLMTDEEYLTPGITKAEYHTRRQALMQAIKNEYGEAEDVVVLASAKVKYMSRSIFYDFRQASDFWYLSGFQEPDSVIVLERSSAFIKGYKFTIFCRSNNAKSALWDGFRTGPSGVIDIFGADEAYDIGQAQDKLRGLLPKYERIWIDDHTLMTLFPSISQAQSKLPSFSNSVPSTRKLFGLISDNGSKGGFDESIRKRKRDVRVELAKLRRVKSEAELRVLREAGRISGRAFAKTMQFAKPGMSEAQLQAKFEYECRMSGCSRPAYVPVVASGENALTIHYTRNDELVQKGDMVLMDAGGEYAGYASDISRTFPIASKFTPPQRALYEAVLRVQKECIRLCTETEALTMDSLHRISARLLTQELRLLGFKGGRIEQEEVERELYIHCLSHGMGIDLHETDDTRNRILEEGMVLTIEPGIYVRPGRGYPDEFEGLGVRIEDDVVVGHKTSVSLTPEAPKEVADIEAICLGEIAV